MMVFLPRPSLPALVRSTACAMAFGAAPFGGATASEPKAPAPAAPPIAPADAKFFEEKVRPLLVQHCHQCHAGDKDKGGLRLDSRTAALTGGESGAAFVPGKPDASLLVEAVKYESYEMPPAGKLPAEEIAVFEEWVRRGAPWPGGDVPHVAKKKRGEITDEDRNFWSFKPLSRPAVPAAEPAARIRNEIDAFIFAKLAAEGLAPAPDADKALLARRLYFDLHGLPPSPEDLARFLADASPDAYERLVDRLLESPRYGERWARHWLDLVRYAESDGFREDAYRPTAWRYRDYVVRSFNEDKPYDRFLTEQLAGDEIAPDDPQAVTATGFLRHGMYEYNQRDVRTQWSEILNEATDVTADVFLGLGMGCARCHDHKFDPILQKDYFRLQAFLAPMRPRDDVPLLSPRDLNDYRTRLRVWEERTAAIRSEIEAIEQAVIAKAAKGAIEKFPEDIQVILNKPESERTPLERQLAELAYRQVQLEFKEQKFEKRIAGKTKERWAELKKQLADFDGLKPEPLPLGLTVTDIGAVAPPTIIPGDRKEEPIEPGFLTLFDPRPAEILPAPSASGTTAGTTARRTTLAKWLTRPDHPLTTRVIVNRVWQYHFGRGLSPSSSDFGKLGEAPSHPELLDWLAGDFVAHGWSFKRLHRKIVLSTTYRQTAFAPDATLARTKDPENRFRWKTTTRRLDAEQIRDAVLCTTGEIDFTAGGPSVDAGSTRRTVYTKLIRNTRDAFLDVFDAPEGISSTPERLATTTPNQALMQMNGKWLLDRAKAFAKRLQPLGRNDAERVAAAYRLAYGRDPSAEEVKRAVAFLQRAPQTAPKPASPAVAGPVLRLTKFPNGLDTAAEFRRGVKDAVVRIDPQPIFPAGDFTVEATVHLRSIHEDARVNTIAAQWDSHNEHRGWALGVTSEKSKYRPRNLILQLIGQADGKDTLYEPIASNLFIELDKTWQIAVGVHLSEQGRSEVVFRIRELGQEKWQTSTVQTPILGKYRNDAVPLTLGGRVGQQDHGWDGWLDDVRISRTFLDDEDLFKPELPKQAQVLAHWRFDDANFPGKDALGSHLTWTVPKPKENAPSAAQEASQTALADFCHALLISNEFLYVD